MQKIVKSDIKIVQEESRSISENVTWGKRKAMQDGHVSLPWSSFLGYEKGEDGLPKIVPEQAEIVRLIFTLFMNGQTYHSIARELTSRGKAERAGRAKIIARFIKSISKQGAVSEFDDDLWFAVIEHVVVGVDGSLTFKFKNGIEINN